MYGIASFFFFVVFKTWITPDLATEYLAGAVLLGAAPCTAMVFVWSTLTKGNPAYTVVQVASNDIIILFAFVPIVKFLLGVSNVSVPFQTLFMSVVLFVVIPLAAGIITRLLVVRKKGTEYFEQTFLHKFDSATTVGLLLTLILIFMFQGEVVLDNPLHIILIAVPLIIQTFFIFFLAFGVCRIIRLPYDITKLQINQDAVRIMKELYGIDMEAEGQYSKLIDEIPVPDIAISMGCNVGCPFIERPFDDNWGLEDPTGKSDEEFKKVIDEIRMQIFILKQRLDEFEEN